MAEAIQVQTRLSDYLGTELERFRVLASGWETTVFEFAIRSAATRTELPPGRPLVLRFYHGPDAATKGSREYAVIKRLAAAHFPVPAPYGFEPDPGALGAPFLIMERLEGGPLLRLESFANAIKTFTLAFLSFVRFHTRLHRLDPAQAGIAAIAAGFQGPRQDRPAHRCWIGCWRRSPRASSGGRCRGWARTAMGQSRGGQIPQRRRLRAAHGLPSAQCPG